MHLDIETAGDGAPVVLLHGLTATKRYVVMGSKALERSGHRVIAYDARGHGASDPPAERDAYAYEDLAADLGRVMDDHGVARATLAGASMGAHTILRFALDHPERVAALCVITPAFTPRAHGEAGSGERDLDRWDRLADGLRRGGVDGFIEAYGEPPGDEAMQKTLRTVLRQRLSAHEHPEAVADALQAVPRAPVFDAWSELGAITAPTVVVASRDQFDPGHPLAVGERYAEAIPGARRLTEEEGKSPLAWQGGQLSKVIADLAASAA